ncbi:hypothetical protein [Micromonospora fulviviridis]
MTDMTEKAILAGGCLWGRQDLIRNRAGVLAPQRPEQISTSLPSENG